MGFLLAVLGFIIVMFATRSSAVIRWCGTTCICHHEPPPLPPGMVELCCDEFGSECGITEFWYATLPRFYGLGYIPPGVVLYIIGTKFDFGVKFKLRFLGKSLFIGGVIGIALATLIVWLVITLAP